MVALFRWLLRDSVWEKGWLAVRPIPDSMSEEIVEEVLIRASAMADDYKCSVDSNRFFSTCDWSDGIQSVVLFAFSAGTLGMLGFPWNLCGLFPMVVSIFGILYFFGSGKLLITSNGVEFVRFVRWKRVISYSDIERAEARQHMMGYPRISPCIVTKNGKKLTLVVFQQFGPLGKKLGSRTERIVAAINLGVAEWRAVFE